MTAAALSLSEVDSIALKAARGAGLPWGLAEEAAFAARWLAEQGVDGLTLLARLLALMPRETLGSAPLMHDRRWQTQKGGPLCPIGAGTALNDHFALPQGPLAAPLHLCNLSTPALVLPLMAAAAARCNAVVIAEWADCQVVLSSGRLLAIGGAQLLADQAALLTVTALPAGRPATPPGPSAATLAALGAHVARTYVPASDQSRRGAGASDAETA